MANLREIVAVYQNLTQEWNKKPVNLDKCGDLLINLKVCSSLVQFNLRNQVITRSFPTLIPKWRRHSER